MSSRRKKLTPRARATTTTVSVVFIVKNEEKVLDESLAAVTWADEIVVYDTGSTDGTLEIARRYTSRVVEGYWDDDFGAARNRAMAHATSTWILTVDADEVFDGDPRALRTFLAGTHVPIVNLQIVNLSGTKSINDNDFVAGRLMRRGLVAYRGRLHEQPTPLAGVKSPAVPPTAPGRLLHSGYQDEVFAEKNKVQRNIELALADVADAEAAGNRSAAAAARVHLTRTLLGMAGDEAGLESAERAWQPELLTPVAVQELCRTTTEFLTNNNRVDEAERWIQRWWTVDRGPESLVAAAKLAILRGDPLAAAALLDELPEQSDNAYTLSFHRTNLVGFEVAVRLAVQQRELALQRWEVALAADDGDLSPLLVDRCFSHGEVDALIPKLGPRMWRYWAIACSAAMTPRALELLTRMVEHRPGDLTATVCATRLHPVMDLEQAAQWSARVRAIGAADECPLLAMAADPARPARERAVAAALVVSAYRDDHAMGLLAAALEDIPPAEEAGLVAELEIVAPGLVTSG